MDRRLVVALLLLLSIGSGGPALAQNGAGPLPDGALEDLDRGGEATTDAAVSLLASADPAAIREIRRRLTGPGDDLKRAILRAYRDPRVEQGLAEHPETARAAVELVRPFLGAEDSLRQLAADALASLDLDATYEVLTELLVRPPADGLETVREATRVLRRLESRRAIDVLVEAIGRQDDPAVRRVLAESLTTITGTPQPSPEAWAEWWAENRDRPLDEILQRRIVLLEERLREARERAGFWWRRYVDAIPDPATRNREVLDAARRSVVREIRRSAIRELGRSRPEASVEVLVSIATGDDPELALAALEALASWGRGLAEHPDAIRALVGLLDEPDSSLVEQATRVLGLSRSPEALDPLLELASGDGVPSEVTETAVEAIGRIGRNPEDRAFEVIRSVIDESRSASNGSDVLVQAVVALGALPYEGDTRTEAGLLLTGLLGSSNERVRLYAAEAIGRIGDPAGVEPLVNMLGSEGSSAVARSMITAVGQLGREATADVQRTALGALLEALGRSPEVAERTRTAMDGILERAVDPGLTLEALASRLEEAGSWTCLRRLLRPPLFPEAPEEAVENGRRRLLRLRARARLRDGEAAAATADLTTLLEGTEDEEERRELLRLRAEASAAAGETLAADEDLHRLVQAGEDVWSARVGLVERLIEEGRLPRAGRLISRILEGPPEPPEEVVARLESMRDDIEGS